MLLHNDVSIAVMFALTIWRLNKVFCFHENDLIRLTVFKCSSGILFGCFVCESTYKAFHLVFDVRVVCSMFES